MKRIALFTTECCQVNPAITEFLARNHSRVAVVVTSDPYRGQRFGLLKQLIRNLIVSGPRFVKYLSYSFLAYYFYAGFDRVRASFGLGGPRRCFTIRESCSNYGIPHIHTANINGLAVQTQLAAAQIDVIVILWFDQIIKENIIKVPTEGVINVHPAYLPECRGLFPIFYSATENNGVYGVTAHVIDNTEIDAGPILSQIKVLPPRNRTIIYQDAIVNLAGVDLIGAVLDDFPSYHDHRVLQKGGSYFSYPNRSQVADAEKNGIHLASLKDFIAICTGRLEDPKVAEAPTSEREPPAVTS